MNMHRATSQTENRVAEVKVLGCTAGWKVAATAACSGNVKTPLPPAAASLPPYQPSQCPACPPSPLPLHPCDQLHIPRQPPFLPPPPSPRASSPTGLPCRPHHHVLSTPPIPPRRHLLHTTRQRRPLCHQPHLAALRDLHLTLDGVKSEARERGAGGERRRGCGEGAADGADGAACVWGLTQCTVRPGAALGG